MAVYKDNASGTWRVVFRFTNWKGERKQTQKRGFQTKREAQMWEREQLLKQESKLDMTFGSFFEIYTLQKVREVGGDKFSYASDYEIVTKLKSFSDTYGICLLVVHHTRKMESSDSFDMISGTNGLLGAADGAFVMQKEKRTDNKAVLEVAGRDQQDQKLWLNFNREKCVWELTKTETELWKEPDDPLITAIKNLLTEKQPEWSGTASELIELLQLEMKKRLSGIVQEYGYKTVKAFMAEYKASKAEYNDYQSALAKWEKQTGNKAETNSIRTKLSAYKEQVQEQKKQHTQKKDRGAR